MQNANASKVNKQAKPSTKMTNLQFLVNSIQKAKSEQMTIISDGSDLKKECLIVIHNGNGYNVSVEDGKVMGCSCPHSTNRNTICKHMIKASLERNLDIATLNIENN
jgi:hypothetical protein